MKITDFIGEATEYDKKEMLEERKPRSWLKSVSAFANGIGGALIFGVSDDGSLVGLLDARGISEKISEIIKTKMDPIPQVVMENHTEDQKDFIILKVLPGQETPYYYVADGNHVAYVRIGNESVPADAAALKRLVLRGANMTYDSVVSSFMLQDFSFTKLRSVFRMRTGAELTASDFISFELADESGKLTNAGALLADESPMRHSRLFCTRWYGLDKASGVMEALDDKEYSGSLVSLLQNGIEFVKNNTKKRWKKTGTGRVEMPEYPEQAVHEALVNALIHRDYMEIGSEVHIDIFDDRMEIYSPGGMFDGSIVQNLDTDHVASKRRNPVIADIFSRMHFMERRGSGFRKIKADYRRAVNYRDEIEPLFRSTPTSFFVTLYNLNYSVPIEKTGLADKKQVFIDEKTDLQEKKQAFEVMVADLNVSAPTKENIMKMFQHFGFDTVFARADVMKVTGLTATPATELMRKLKNREMIERVKGRGKYRFSEQQV
ncbi:ATP-binding protein [Enterocloster lavalensis]|uniref:ATP-binding protein n=1 Tax=Enterocloster lavalensis TaxID=460384 RepID=UPI0023F24065|nr:ATP-binding protein [Enterocloster lavalensis]